MVRRSDQFFGHTRIEGLKSRRSLGRVFIPHFESGGTFLDFDPAKVQAHYEQQFNAAKAVWRKRDVFAERRGASFCLASDEIGR